MTAAREFIACQAAKCQQDIQLLVVIVYRNENMSWSRINSLIKAVKDKKIYPNDERTAEFMIAAAV
jgi:hypothetical protein